MSDPLLGPAPAEPPGPGWRNAAHVTDVLAAVTSAPYPAGNYAPIIQGASGLLWAGSGFASGVDNVRQQPATRQDRFARGFAVAADTLTTFAGLADAANAGTNAFANDNHDARRGTGQSSNLLWAAAGVTSMLSTGYQTASSLWNGRPALAQGLGFLSATFNTAGAGFGAAATEYSQYSDPASQFNATLYGTLSAASWLTGAAFGIGSTVVARRQQSAAAHQAPNDIP